jgi:hypothetical protein
MTEETNWIIPHHWLSADCSVFAREPGYAMKPLLMDCYAKSGFIFATQLLPIIDNQAQVNFVQNSGSATLQLFPIERK